MSYWSCYKIVKVFKAIKVSCGIQETVNIAQKVSERKSQGNKGKAWKATNSN